MKKFLLAVVILLGYLSVAQAQYSKLQGIVGLGGQTATVSGITSSTKHVKTYGGALVTVYAAGTTTLSTIYSDATGTPRSNPITSSAIDASWSFYAAPGRYDLKFSGGGILTPFTLGDWQLAGVNGQIVMQCLGSNDTTALATASSIGGTIVIPKGITCTSNTQTLSAALQIDNGALLKPLTGQTLTLTGPQIGGSWQRFTNALSGQGTIIIGGTVNPAWWGAKGDGGITDNSGSVQAAIDVAAATTNGGGVVEFSSATDYYGFLSNLSLNAKRNVLLLGPVFNSGNPPYGVELRYTGSGSGSFIDAGVSYGIQIKRLTITYSNAGFSGRLLDFRGSVSLSTQDVTVDECSLYGNGARGAKSLIDFDRVVNSKITDNKFFNADIAVQGGINYANSILIQKNVFQAITSSDIRDTGEAWLIHSNTFQSLYNAGDLGPAGAIDYTGGATKGRAVNIIGNWFGDIADPGTGAWIRYNGDALVVEGNMVSLATGNTFLLIDANGTSGCGLSLNGFQRTGSGGANARILDFGATSGHTGWRIGPNQYDASIDEVTGTLPFNSERIDKAGGGTQFTAGITIGDTAQISAHRTNTATWNPGNLAAGASESVDVTVGGVGVGDTIVVGFPMLVGTVAQGGMQISGTCAVAGTVKVTITNNNVGAVNLDSGTLRVDGWIH